MSGKLQAINTNHDTPKIKVVYYTECLADILPLNHDKKYIHVYFYFYSFDSEGTMVQNRGDNIPNATKVLWKFKFMLVNIYTHKCIHIYL